MQKIKVYVVKWNVQWGPSDPVAVALTREKAEELKAAFEKEWLDAFEIVEFEAE